MSLPSQARQRPPDGIYGRSAAVKRPAGGNLFQIAAQQLGDATQWLRIAQLNGISDPQLTGVVTLIIPDVDASAGGGIATQLRSDYATYAIYGVCCDVPTRPWSLPSGIKQPNGSRQPPRIFSYSESSTARCRSRNSSIS